ncbi:MAG: 6-hydroxymethylpterin diphosphokinase MptE-like protein [Rhodospirillaceae bacterium]
MTDPVSDSLAERSRQALIARFPELEAILAAAPAAVPVHEDEETGARVMVDLNLGNARLYAADGRTLAAKQVEAYLEKPLRFFVTSVRGANVGSPVSGRMLDRMYAECARLGIAMSDLEVKPRYEGSYLVVLGLGLGFHLAPLIEHTAARHIVVIEPYADFLRHSLHTVDWAALFEQVEARGCKITLSLESKPDRIVKAIQTVFSAEGLPFIDGTYVFMHYPAWELLEARDRLARMVETAFVSRGFFEDELLMVSNTIANLSQVGFQLIDTTLKPSRAEPVFVIGSGPSIDHSIDEVKRLRDKAVVFSCGTGLKVCLSHGIIPDFHCEIENGGWVYDSLTLLRDRFGPFTGITLISTLTVDPRVPELFDDRFLFFRDTVSGTRMLAPPQAEVYGAVPTVANTALRTAMCLGFSNFYLFGIDCGTKSEEKKHSKLAVYNDSAEFKQFEDAMDLAYSGPGNFGGTVMADWVFNFSRLMIELLLNNYSIKIYNCSDGARIKRATPRVAAGLTLPGPRLDRTVLKARLRAVLRNCEPGELLAEASFDTFNSELERFRTDLLVLIDAAIAEDLDFVAFWRRLSPLLDSAGPEYAQVPSVILSSLASIPKIGMFFAHRVREPALRLALFHSFLAEYRKTALYMCDTLTACFGALERRYAPAPEVSDGRRLPPT